MRYALYFTPPQDAELTRLAADWLGRDAFSNEVRLPPPVGRLSTNEVSEHTRFPRRYGFHATLKAPFELAHGQSEDGLIAALETFVAGRRAFDIERLAVNRIGGFFALTPVGPAAELNSLADACVRQFDVFRAPLSDADFVRRKPERLPPAAVENLKRWGYPYVFETFRFHMTLTGSVDETAAIKLRPVLGDLFARALTKPVSVDAVTLFVETKAGGDFTVRRRFVFGSE